MALEMKHSSEIDGPWNRFVALEIEHNGEKSMGFEIKHTEHRCEIDL